MMGVAAVFLDRDGTIIEDTHYPRDPETVKLVPNAIEGIQLLQAKGYTLFVVSNQSGVGRGIISDLQFKQVHEKVCEYLSSNGIQIVEFAYCLHKPEDACQCRKPGTLLADKLANDHQVDRSRSFVIGDQMADFQLGKSLGATPCIVLSGKGPVTKEALESANQEAKVYESLLAFAEDIPSLV